MPINIREVFNPREELLIQESMDRMIERLHSDWRSVIGGFEEELDVIGLRNSGATVLAPPPYIRQIVAATRIDPEASEIGLQSTADVTLTSAPTVPDGQNGQVLILINMNAAASGFDITLQDESNLASSNLYLSRRVNITLRPTEWVMLTFSAQFGRWLAGHVSASWLCYDRVVDATGGVGTDLTIQDAIDAYSLSSAYRPWMIAVVHRENAAYSETLTFTGTRRYAVHGCAGVGPDQNFSLNGEAGSGAGLNQAVRIAGQILTTGAGTGTLELRGLDVDVGAAATFTMDVDRMDITLINSTIRSGTTGALQVGVGCAVSAINSVIGDSDTLVSVRLTLGSAFLADSTTVLQGWADLTSQGGVHLDGTKVIADRAGAVIEMGTSQTIVAWRITGAYVRQKNAAGNGLLIVGTVAAEDEGCQVTGTHFQGAGGGTAVIVEADVDGALIVANSIGDWGTGIDAGGATNIIAWPNHIYDTGTPTTGGGGAGTVLTPFHTLLDATWHTDTVTQAVTRGSLVYGNATPAWDELVIGAANSVLWTDGTDPSWTTSPALAGTLTVDTINEFTADAGLTIESVYLENGQIAIGGDVSAIHADNAAWIGHTWSGALGATAKRGLLVDVVYAPSAATTALHAALRFNTQVAAGNAQDFSFLMGILGEVQLRGTGDKTSVVGVKSFIQAMESNTALTDAIFFSAGGIGVTGTGSTVSGGVWGLEINDLAQGFNAVSGQVVGIEILAQDALGASSAAGIIIRDITNATSVIPIYQAGSTGGNRIIANTKIGADETPVYKLDVESTALLVAGFESTNTGTGLQFDFFLNSPTPANFDVVMSQVYYGNDDAVSPNKTAYGTFRCYSADVVDGSEDGRFEWLLALNGSLVSDMVLREAGQLQLPVTGSGAGLLVGGDVQWYRNAANVWRTPDSVLIDGTLTVGTAPNYTVTNALTDRTYNADSTTLDELSDIVGTLIADLITIGLLQ